MREKQEDMLSKGWRNKIRGVRHIYVGVVYSIFVLALPNYVQALTLENIEFSVQSEGRLQIQLDMDGPAFEPKVFRTDNPARIAFDFPGVTNGLKQKIVPVNVGATSGLHVIEAGGRTRVVINLLDQTPFETTVQGNQLLVTLQNNKSSQISDEQSVSAQSSYTDGLQQSITNIDFRRGKQGEGRVLISLTDPDAVVDVQEQGGKVVLYFMNTELPEHLAKRLDVTDFATPVESIETSLQGGRPKMVITPLNSQYDYLSYQSEGLLTLEFRSLTKAEQIEIKKKKFAFSGERLSLNFQDIPVRSVLQILADFTEMNIVAADSVKGNVTLRLNNVPWDQALDMILKSKGLGQRQEGNIMRIAPVTELNKQEKEELEAIQFKEELEPLKIEFIQVKYAKASDLKKVITGFKDNAPLTTRLGGGYISDQRSASESASESASLNRSSILSSRGVVNIDERTNLLIVKDTGRNLEAIRRLVRELDTPVRQVLIEARVVVASNDFTKELGFRLGANKNFKPNDQGRLMEAGGDLANGLLVDLAAASPAGAMGFTLAKVGNYLLDLEISALEQDGKGEVISSPRIVTSDKQTAEISQGFEIPYSTISQNGTNTQFKKAELKLEVTPLITPDDQVQMELTITKDVPLSTQAGAEPALETREIKTSVQVGNGETIVLGGVYEGQSAHANKRVPFFADLPGIGFLFQQNQNVDSKKELLIFITPKILKPSLKTI